MNVKANTPILMGNIKQRLLEQISFNRFKEYLNLDKSIKEVEHRENPLDPPDFYLKFRNEISWGIEITSLVNVKKENELSSPHEKARLLKGLTIQIENAFNKLYKTSTTPHQEVQGHIFFTHNISLSKGKLEEIATSIAKEIFTFTENNSLLLNINYEAPGKYPDFIQKVELKIVKPSIINVSWKFTTTAWLDYPTDHLITKAIMKKEKVIKNFTVNVDVKVLLIVSGDQYGSFFSQRTEKVKGLKSNFDKVFFMDLDHETIIELV